MQMTERETYTALAVVEHPPTALLEYTAGEACAPALLARATAMGLPPAIAQTACTVLQKAVRCLDEAGRARRGTFKRVKLIETAVDACREPVASALRLGMLASPTDGRAFLRLWCDVCEPWERNKLVDMLRTDVYDNDHSRLTR